ncbi:hypothetical protein DL95DRAFT_308442 [Leptodontidium sp. 2 PMI_412]|nr:hypothetical protein DL95DRAFT_308442 [Leptodontidium sp. 2 PMI_412]
MYADFDEDEKNEITQDLYAEKRAALGQIKYLDVFRRKTRGRVEDRYVDPTDGRLGVLVIQASTSIYNSRNKTTWRRTYIENVSPYFVRLAYWPMSGNHQNPDEWGRDRWIYVGLRWLPSCIGILISMFGPTDAGGQIRNNGFYDPFSYRFWSYPKIARNVYENRPPGGDSSRIEDRIIRPRKLCFLDATSEENPNGLLAEEAWGGRKPTYIFISYTGQGQFGRRCKTKALHRIARVAASNAGVSAYWTDQCCMSTDPEEFSKDIYRISDVVRNADSLAIVLGESGGGKTKQIQELLVEWGTRLWTFPEALLAPSKKDILIYRRGYDNSPLALSRLELSHRTWAKNQFCLRVRELIDHYDNTLTLSRLELVVIVLECLLSRETTIFSEGDLAYALMGLLRQRPTTDKSDSAFQAFARLSLANDSDRLLERMICLLPKDQLKFNSRNRHYWATLDDFWDAKLWDIEPICQIAAIGMDDTVVLDGAHAATIHWNSFQRVAITTKETWTRMISRTLLRLTPVYLSSGIISILARSTPAAVIFMILAVVFTLISPLLILHVYSGKVWSTQPWLFGFEGHLPIKEIEKKIFGFPQNRLTWAPYASTFSRHRPHESFLKNECRGIDPTKDAAVKSLVDRGPTAEYGEPRVFTLLTSGIGTVTLFAAERPPVVALLCGSEGGMQRAIMCSYDWPTQTLYRETVLRMETRVLEKMPRVGRVSFGLRRNVQGEPETWPSSSLETTDLADGPMWV